MRMRNRKQCRRHACRLRGRLGVEPLEPRLMLATMLWDGGGDGTSWIDPLNWDTDEIPDGDDRAVIDLEGDYTVALSTDVTVQELELGGSTGAQTLDVGNKTVTLGNAGIIGANAVVTLGNGNVSGDGILVNHGLLQVRGYSTIGTLAMSPGSTLRILGNAAGSDGGVGSLTVTNGFANDGLIELDSIGSGQNFTYARLIVTSGTLTNGPGGVIRTLPGVGRARTLEAQIVQSRPDRCPLQRHDIQHRPHVYQQRRDTTGRLWSDVDDSTR